WGYGTPRTGFAGIVASSGGGPADFDVDYILIKASGLPSITVTPSAFVQIPVAITNQPQSQTVFEGAPVTFSVGASGLPRPTYQWYRGTSPISLATDSSYTIPVTSLSDSNANFRVVAQNVVSNTTYSATSSVATLTVQADTVAPTLWLAQAVGLSQVQVIFSERVTP